MAVLSDGERKRSSAGLQIERSVQERVQRATAVERICIMKSLDVEDGWGLSGVSGGSSCSKAAGPLRLFATLASSDVYRGSLHSCACLERVTCVFYVPSFSGAA